MKNKVTGLLILVFIFGIVVIAIADTLGEASFEGSVLLSPSPYSIEVAANLSTPTPPISAETAEVVMETVVFIYDSIDQMTREYEEQVTQQASVYMQGTAVAIAGETATSVSLNKTREVIEVSATGTAIAIELLRMDAEVRQNDILTEEMIEDAKMRMDAESRRIDNDIKLDAVARVVWMVLWWFVVLFFALIFGYGLFVYFRGRMSLLQPSVAPVPLQSQNIGLLSPSAQLQQVDGNTNNLERLRNVRSILNGRKASWELFSRWNERDKVPIGVGLSGPLMIDVKRSPHLMVLGSTRKGKTTAVLCFVSYLIRRGDCYAVFVNERAANFSPFYRHPKAVHVREFQQQKRPLAVHSVLMMVLDEMERRDRVLYDAELDTWDEYRAISPQAAGNVVVVVDELLAVANSPYLSSRQRNEVLGTAVSLTSEAGKFGIFFVGMSTDPTKSSFGNSGRNLLKQCGRLVFGLNDRGSSLSVLGNQAAYGLPTGHFVMYGVDSELDAGISFHPTKVQLSQYVNEGEAKKPTDQLYSSVIALSSGQREEVVSTSPHSASSSDASKLGRDSLLVSKYVGAGNIKSVTALARKLGDDGNVGWGSSGQNIERLKSVLQYRSQNHNCLWSRDLLLRNESRNRRVFSGG